MKVLVSGSTGFVGSALIDLLKRQGHTVVRLVRHRGNFDEAQVGWDINRGMLDPKELEGIDAVVHLAGESIFGRWTAEKKEKIETSRVKGTQLLVNALTRMQNPPKTLVCASAIGYYGSRGDERLTEVSGSGQGFLAKVCREWEAATQPAAAKGIRVVNTRFSMILDPRGGALKVMYWPFRLGVAGNLGNGRQYMSWVTLDDVIHAIYHVLMHDEIRGPVNVVSPNPVTNAQFTKAMHQTVTCLLSPGRIWAPPAPALAIKAIMGQMGTEMLLASQRTLPVRLQESGYQFRHPELKQALRDMV